MQEGDYLAEQAKIARHMVLDMIFKAKASHIGCAFSIIDILIALYFGEILKIDPKQPQMENRDIFILSKGHACTALYATLALKGFFPRQLLEEYGKDGSRIPCHVTLSSLPGIEATAGSLGHGLSIGVGISWNAVNKNKTSRTFVLVGDGECQEGSIWEAVMFAGHHKLNNLVLIVDYNNLETVGNINNILDLEPLDEKFRSFGWGVKTINGHSFPQIKETLSYQGNQPLAIIAKTTKGKGVSFMENMVRWHGKCPTNEEYEQAKKELIGGSS